MRFVITGGGTAGHINPALAVAQELRSFGHEVYFAGAPNSMEAELIPQAGLDFVGFESAGFNRSKPWTILTSTLKIAASSRKALRWLKSLYPQAVVGFGGYVSIAVGLAASRAKIPLIIHEQNSTSGMANRFLAKRAQLVALSYADVAEDFKAAPKVIVTGNPVRAELGSVDPARARLGFNIPKDARVLLVFGGSLGAAHINKALVAHAQELMRQSDLYVIHVAGTRNYAATKDELASCGIDAERWLLLEYCNNMGEAYAAADAVMSRAGATTLAELIALKKPALLVPYPFAAADEQTTNARPLVQAGAAEMISDAQLDEPIFMEKLNLLLSDAAHMKKMQAAAESQGGQNARIELAQAIIKQASAYEKGEKIV